MNVIAHIRKATVGPVGLENCHPFKRELWGRYWVFAHNGDVPTLPFEHEGIYRPVGQTDSERAFCLILNTIRQRFPDRKPPIADLYAVLREVTAEIAQYGIFNYLLSDGEHFWIFRNSRGTH